MSLDAELRVAELLKAGTPPEQIAERLIADVFSQKPSAKFISQVGHFLYNAGLTQRLFLFVKELTEQNLPLPWGAIAQGLAEIEEDIPINVMESLLQGAGEENALPELAVLSKLAKHHPRLIELRDNQKAHRLRQMQEQRQVLIDKLNYLKSQRMIKEEGRTFEDFKKLFPGDPFIRTYNEEFGKRQASHIIEEMNAKPKSRRRSTTPVRHSPIALKWARDLLTACIATVKSDPKAAIDFAVLFYFLEFYDEALTVLELSPPSPTADWLRLELKMLSRRFVDAIEEARRLEQKYALDPEATFSTTYARAQCLWELGQENLAMNLLQGIINIRPHFRSAHSLLQQWREELT